MDNQNRHSYPSLLNEKLLGFCFFSQLPQTKNLILKEDISKIDELIQNYEFRTRNAAILSYAAVLTTVFLLRRRNKILQLTKKVHVWEILKKYFIVPQLLVGPYQICEILSFSKSKHDVLEKYDFSLPIFKDAYCEYYKIHL